MFIAFEGCDGTGKSSLAGAVAAEIMARDSDCSVHEIHRSQLKRPPLDEYVHDVSRYKPGTKNHVVADRWHWGEEVYGPIYREKSAATLAQFRWTEMWLASRGANVWHVTQPHDVLVKRLTERGEDYLRPEHVTLVQEMFADVAKASITHTADVSPEGDTSAMVKRIVDRAEYTDRSVAAIQDFPSYVGPALPHTLLVGDKRGGPGPYVTKSAFMPVNGNSADFLLSALPDDFWRGVGLVNANETGEALVPLLDALCGPAVVALGRAASDTLLDLDIEHAGVPHPQFMRRFHNAKKTQYGMMIRENARTGEMKYSWQN
jgi:hypothetical protein